MTRTGTILAGAALALGLAAGCTTGGKPKGGGDTDAGAIGLSVLTMTNPFFKEIAEAVTDEAGKSGFKVTVTSAEFDPAKQRTQVKNFIVQGVNAIILTPADSKAVGTAIREANDAGIPVFTADIASLAEGAKVVSHIATDNLSGGRQAAKAMMQALGNKGRVAIIDHPEVESVILRTKGFRDQLKEAGSKIEIVGAWPGKGSKDKSYLVAQDILTAHKDLAGIFAINDPTALGAYAAVEKKGLAGKIVIVGQGRQDIRGPHPVPGPHRARDGRRDHEVPERREGPARDPDPDGALLQGGRREGPPAERQVAA
ncbi:MAG: substrate-binding domain-containing protein [Planctomycetota bacterium]|jgi:ribose transport system substrate-binding protein